MMQPRRTFLILEKLDEINNQIRSVEHQVDAIHCDICCDDQIFMKNVFFLPFLNDWGIRRDC